MPSCAHLTFRNAWRRFRRNRRGSAAVEFALVAPVFFALLFAIIETAIMFFASQVLETITQESARMVMTGQVQAASDTQAMFLNNVACAQIPAAIFKCSNLAVDVRSYSTFSSVVMSSQIDANGNFINNMQYNPGGPGDIVVVRMFYPWQLFVTGLGYNIANMTGSQRLLYGTAAFQNEPY
jgi:Flp pilus assembly protein TadG